MDNSDDCGGDPAVWDDGASNVLLRAPSLNGAEAAVCTDLSTGPSAARENLLVLEYWSADSRIQECLARPGPGPARMTLVSPGSTTRSAAATTDPVSATVTVEEVENGGDLATIGTALTDALRAWEATPEPTFVCIHSLTGMLQCVDVEAAFRFLHVLTSRVEATGARAHYHLDPNAHSEETVETLSLLFDRVIDVAEDGSVTVRDD